VWLWSSRSNFIAGLILVYSQFTERGHLAGIPLEQLYTEPNNAATVRNISGTAFRAVVTFFWMSLIPWNFLPCNADFIFEKSHKSSGSKSGERGGGCSISVIDFWARNCLTESALWAGALSWWRIQSLGQISGLFLRTASRNILGWYLNVYLNASDYEVFNIFFGSVRSWTTTSIIIFHVLVTLFKPFLPLRGA